MNEPEFIRGNQKTYVRILCKENITEDYEYKMCLYNEPESLLKFQQRSYNGEYFVYYEVSGMQSLDVIVQSKMLKRPMVIIIIRSIIKLCREFAEYVLDMNKVIWDPKYIMVKSNNEEIQFVYSFPSKVSDIAENQKFESLLEFFIEYLDYQDDLLITQMYQVYDILIEQKEHFIMLQEMEKVLNQLTGADGQVEIDNEEQDMFSVLDVHSLDDVEIKQETVIPKMSEVRQKEKRHLKSGMMALLVLDISLLFWWTPLTLLKLFFVVAVGLVLVGMIMHMRKQERKKQKDKEDSLEQSAVMEEYHIISDKYETEQEETCLMPIEENIGVLINLQKGEPQNIYINEIRKIIGKDQSKAQVILNSEGISRMHALVYRLDEKYFVEDLNSTNGTMVNGKLLEPRESYVLQEGDKIRFAGMEYIFRK